MKIKSYASISVSTKSRKKELVKVRAFSHTTFALVGVPMGRCLFLIAVFCAGISLLFAERSFFSFSNHPIDVVIPSVEKDLLTLDLCIQGIRENAANIRRIIVVSKRRLTDKAEWFNEANYPFSFQDVALALTKNKPELMELLLQKGERVGWYYQQLLKLYAPLVIPDISPNVLILDSDAIFLNRVSFLNEKNAGMYNPGAEYHPPYFHHAAQLLPGFYKRFLRYSGISHHMLFQKPVIEALFDEVQQYHHQPFWQIFCHLVNAQSIFSGASEYEIYFNYVFARTNQVSIRFLKWENIHKLSEISKLKKRGLHYVCLHSYARKE